MHRHLLRLAVASWTSLPLTRTEYSHAVLAIDYDSFGVDLNTSPSTDIMRAVHSRQDLGVTLQQLLSKQIADGASYSKSTCSRYADPSA